MASTYQPPNNNQNQNNNHSHPNHRSENYFYSFIASRYHIPVTFDVLSNDSKDLVKSLIPYDHFRTEITTAVQSDPELAKCDQTELMVIKLLDYFKHNFFTWIDVLDCDQCGRKCRLVNVQQTSSSSSGNINFEYLDYLTNHADQVEIYYCDNCMINCRFPRYNDPRKLLQTRRGRCGEWANCFVYILRCLDIPVRLVHCTTDHVWAEFYNQTEKRWIHADPCENVYDNPLMYQVGWHKMIDLVVARGEHELRDVTWRYTAKWKMTAGDRRRKFDECKLNEVFNQWNVLLQSSLDYKVRTTLQERWIEELVEFIRLPGLIIFGLFLY